VEFKKYGVSLSFVPFVLSSNRIRLVVEPELSEIDTTRAGDVPSLTTRKAKTTVELSPGESFMVAGLIRDQINTAVQEIPGIAEVPIISALMRSTSYQRQETELVISVTPYIVDPVVHSDIRMPTDEYRTPSTMELFFYGALGSLSGNSYKISQKPVLEGPVGFMTE
jgi:pilus assembly protein CpaC